MKMDNVMINSKELNFHFQVKITKEMSSFWSSTNLHIVNFFWRFLNIWKDWKEKRERGKKIKKLHFPYRRFFPTSYLFSVNFMLFYLNWAFTCQTGRSFTISFVIGKLYTSCFYVGYLNDELEWCLGYIIS